MMENMTTVALFLQTFGGWGMCVILLAAIIYLYRSMNVVLERRHNEIVDVLRETTALLQQNADQARRVEAVLGRVERILDR